MLDTRMAFRWGRCERGPSDRERRWSWEGVPGWKGGADKIEWGGGEWSEELLRTREDDGVEDGVSADGFGPRKGGGVLTRWASPVWG